MSIIVNENTRVVVSGITGSEGSFHARRCLQYGTRIVAGMTPGKGGTKFDDTIPVFNRVEEAVRETGANASLVFVPPAFAADAIMEAADAGLKIVVCITEGIPTLDMLPVLRFLKERGTRLIGPNCPGLISPPARCKIGIMPGDIHRPGTVGVVSRSGTLTYEAVAQLTEAGLGQSTCIGIGGDPTPGTGFAEVLELFEKDADTEAVVLIGEIGGTMEQEAAEVVKRMTKPVVAFIAGATAPPGRRMGHAGAIISGASGTAKAKIEALKAAGATIAPGPGDIGTTTKKVLEGREGKRK